MEARQTSNLFQNKYFGESTYSGGGELIRVPIKMNHNGAANWAAPAAHPISRDLETRPQAAGTCTR